jgi:hypothetical protein
MKLIFIHGIAQQDYGEHELLGIWTDHLLDHGIDAAQLKAAEPEMAYYGKELYRWTQGDATGPVAMGPVGDAIEADFFNKAMNEIAAARGISETEIETEIGKDGTVTAQSTWLGRRAVAILSILEQISPLRGSIAAKVVRQANTYLANKNARKAVDNLVRPRLECDQAVVVSHSLGTIVAFTLLRELAEHGHELKVPLFITIGSPLAIKEVQKRVGGDFAIPGNIAKWMNFYDKGDPVTLGRALNNAFADGIVDTVVNNNTLNGHSIAGYLDDHQLVDALNAVL